VTTKKLSGNEQKGATENPNAHEQPKQKKQQPQRRRTTTEKSRKLSLFFF